MDRSAGEQAKERLRAWARELGLSAVGVAPAEPPLRGGELLEWLRRGYHASMHYLARGAEGRYDPQKILEGCRSVVCAALDYGAGDDPFAADPSIGRISRYAWGTDYHVVMKEKLEALAARIREGFPGARTRVAVDTSPVLERAFAAEAGLGWIGKHTLAISPGRGSWFFLGEIFTTLPLPRDAPVADHCGSCRRCLDVCPTGAIVEPYWLDARRCLSYWNIEHRGTIETSIRGSMGNWIFGCDLCQEVCPWNRHAPRSPEPAFAPRPGLIGRPLEDWESLTREEYRELFRESAVKRARYDGLRRNIAIASKNAEQGRVNVVSGIETPMRLHVASWSPECRAARAELDRRGLRYETAEVAPAASALQAATGSRRLPALEVGGGWWIGFSPEAAVQSVRIVERAIRPLAGEVHLPLGGAAPRGAVVLIHGFKGFKDWGFFPEAAAALARAGIAALRFNVSGCGILRDGEIFDDPAGFESNTLGKERADLDAAFHFLRRSLDGLFPGAEIPIGILGHSRGGGIAVLYAAENPEVRALVTWAAIARADRFGEAEQEAWRRGETVPIVNARTGQTFHLRRDFLDDLERNRERYDLLARAREVSCPWLILHGAQDESVPCVEGRELHRAAGGEGAGRRLRLSVVPDTGHTFGAKHPLSNAPESLRSVLAETVSWFLRHLPPA